MESLKSGRAETENNALAANSETAVVSADINKDGKFSLKELLEARRNGTLENPNNQEYTIADGGSA